MNAKKALDVLNKGDRIQTIWDGEEVFYQVFQGDVIARMVSRSACSAEITDMMNPEEFLANVDGINLVKAKV